MTERKLEGRVAVITGAAGGLGGETARVLTGHGASVAIADLNYQGAVEMADEINQSGGHAHALACDVSLESDVKAMAAEVVQKFGRIDILHNNAAILSVEQRSHDVLSLIHI